MKKIITVRSDTVLLCIMSLILGAGIGIKLENVVVGGAVGVGFFLVAYGSIALIWSKMAPKRRLQN